MKTRHFIALITGILVFAIPSFAKDKPLKITENGSSAYVIVVPAKATASEQQVNFLYFLIDLQQLF
jgi:competence protein ComGC